VHEFWGRYVIHLLTPQVPKYAVLLVALAVSLALAWLVHRYVERPWSGRLRRNVQRTLEGAAQECTARLPAMTPHGERPVPRRPAEPAPVKRSDGTAVPAVTAADRPEAARVGERQVTAARG
jgi:hypothetical protein